MDHATHTKGLAGARNGTSDAVNESSGFSRVISIVRRGCLLACAVTFVACVFVIDIARAIESEDEAFTVADSIGLTHLVPLSDEEDLRASAALFSADRRRFLLHTRRGDLVRNVNVATLLLFEAQDIDAYLAFAGGRSAPPTPRPLVQWDVAHDWGGISQVQWLSANEIGCRAAGPGGRNEVFAIDTESGKVTRLTHGSADVASFTGSSEDVLFYAHTPVAQQPLAMSVGNQRIGEVIFPGEARDTPIELFHLSRRTGAVRRVHAPAVRLLENFTRIWLSPRGDYAVTLSPAINAPKHWAAYRVPRYETLGYTPDRVRSDPASRDLEFRTRYQLVDLKANTVRPLLDAPSGFLALNGTPLEVFWPREGRSVIVSNTFLPLDVRARQIREHRTARPAIAEIDLVSGAVTTIAWEPALTPEILAGTERLKRIVSIAWDDSTQRLTVAAKSGDAEVDYSQFQKRGRTWRSVSATRAAPAAHHWRVARLESLNERPKVYVSGGHCACRKLLWDPNPGMERSWLAPTEVFKWTDGNGIDWQGGLIYPPRYVSGQRYPLIVQTHGFTPQEFLIDGPSGVTTAMAARSFANAGFLVLQVEDNPRATTHDERESSRYVEGYRSAIAKLIEQGSVDAAKVGLIAFSRTVRHAMQLLAEHPNLLVAVTLADGSWWGYMNELLSLNMPPDIAAQLRQLRGATPAEVGLAQWLADDPIYRATQARTAVRIEAIGPGTALGMWELYAVLRRADRPVDFIYFPQGSHVLHKPQERLASQGGNVDWFRFWMQGYEDPDPAKAQQYARWTRLRK